MYTSQLEYSSDCRESCRLNLVFNSFLKEIFAAYVFYLIDTIFNSDAKTPFGSGGLGAHAALPMSMPVQYAWPRTLLNSREVSAAELQPGAAVPALTMSRCRGG